MTLLPDIDIAFERQLVQQVAQVLERRGWSVVTEPVLGPSRPDLIAFRDDGIGVLAEFKVAANRPVHFASVAQTASYARLAEFYLPIGDAAPALVAAGEATPSVSATAETLGVHLISTVSAEPRRLAEDVATQLERAVQTRMAPEVPDEVPEEAVEIVRASAGDPALGVLQATRRAGGGAPRWHLKMTDSSWWRVSHTVHGWNAARLPMEGV